jgi:hypothetical protein
VVIPATQANTADTADTADTAFVKTPTADSKFNGDTKLLPF